MGEKQSLRKGCFHFTVIVCACVGNIYSYSTVKGGFNQELKPDVEKMKQGPLLFLNIFTLRGGLGKDEAKVKKKQKQF